MKKVIGVFLVTVLIAGMVLTVGCGSGGGGDGFAAILGAIAIVAIISATGGGAAALPFAANIQKPAAEIRFASRSVKFVGRVKLSNGTSKTVELDLSDDKKQLTLNTTIPDVGDGKQQIAIDVLPAGSTGDPIFKTITTATVSGGNTASINPTVDYETTAKVMAYEKWAGAATKPIDEFTPNAASITALAASIAAELTGGGTEINPSSTFTFSAAVTNGATAVAAAVPVPTTSTPTSSSNLEAMHDEFMTALFQLYSGQRPTDAQITSLEGLLADDFVHMGYTRATFLAALRTPAAADGSITLASKGTFEQQDHASGIVRSHRASTLAFTKAGSQNTMTLPTLAKCFIVDSGFGTYDAPSLGTWDLSIFHRKQTDGTYRILGNQQKIWGLDHSLSVSTQYQGNITTHLWASIEEAPQYPIKSVEWRGSFLQGTLNLVKDGTTWDPASTDWNNRHVAGIAPNTPDASIVLQVTFNDNSSQRFTFKQGDTTGIEALTGVTMSQSGNILTVTWPKSPDADFSGYWISTGSFTQQDERESWDLPNKDTTTLVIDLSKNGFNRGDQVYVEINAGNMRGYERSARPVWTVQ